MDSGELVEGSAEFVLVFSFVFVGRIGTGNGCFPLEPRASDSKPIKIKRRRGEQRQAVSSKRKQVNNKNGILVETWCFGRNPKPHKEQPGKGPENH